MKNPFILFLLSLTVLVLCIWALWPNRQATFDDKELTLYCAAGLRVPVSEIITDYEEETGRTVKVIYNGSGALLSQLKIGGGDLYLPANHGYIEEAAKDDLTVESIPATQLTAVIVVDKDNTNIQSLEDLTRDGIRISFADKSAAIGKFTRNALQQEGMLKAIKKNITVTKPTVNNIIEDVLLGSVDATIAWDAVANNYPNLRTIKVPVFEQNPRKASIAVLRSSQHPTAALHFARYLTAKEKGLKTFEKHHFKTPKKTDSWSDTPKILLFSGSMLRPAIDDRIHEFEKREGCEITTVYEGCGTLVAQMKAGATPGFYFSCDVSFLDQVEEKFEPGTVVTQNEIILLVPKNNPKNILSLDDLSSSKLKVGVAHPVKSALGKLTDTMLKASGHLAPLQQSGNIIVLASKGDELVTQMQAGALDAALLYRSNAMASEAISRYCSIIQLNRPDAIATQPFSSSKDTPYPQLLHRLGNYLSNEEAKKTFLHYGFMWKSKL
jgi:molybdate transport system substrate-binding protein